MKAAKIVSVLLVVAMLFSFAACGGGGNNTTSDGGNKPSKNPNVGVRVDANGNLLYKPEDVGEIDNPIVTGLIAPPATPDYLEAQITWREDAYGIEYKYDQTTWNEREVKWISSYVSGTAYDVITYINYPTTVVKGLLEPLDEHLPLADFPEYFVPSNPWGEHYYGVACIPAGYDDSLFNPNGIYGVFYNVDIFEDNGQPLPGDLFDNGEWTLEAMYEAAKNLTLDSDRDGKPDIIGLDSYENTMFTICNGATTVSMSGDSIALTWDDPKYVEGLEWLIKFQPYMGIKNAFTKGGSAMYVERLGTTTQSLEQSGNDINWDWVPYPKGPSGEGQNGSLGYGTNTWNVCKGAKNIEGAKVFICADIARYDYVEKTSNEDTAERYGEKVIERAKTCTDKFVKEYSGSVGSIGDKMWGVWGSVAELGAKATIEKYTPVLQKEIDNLLATEKVPEPVEFKSPGTLDFEDGNVVLKEVFPGTVSVTEDSAEVINGSKSLKIQMSVDNPWGPLAVTTNEHYALSYGGQYKLTFKIKAVGGTASADNPVVVQFRPTSSLEDKDDTTAVGGYNTIDLSDGQVHEFELMINIMDAYDDLQLFIIGSAGESSPNLALILDDLTIEEVKA